MCKHCICPPATIQSRKWLWIYGNFETDPRVWKLGACIRYTLLLFEHINNEPITYNVSVLLQEKETKSSFPWCNLTKSKPRFELSASLPVSFLVPCLSVVWAWILTCELVCLCVCVSLKKGSALPFNEQHLNYPMGQEWGRLHIVYQDERLQLTQITHTHTILQISLVIKQCLCFVLNIYDRNSLYKVSFVRFSVLSKWSL